jgi:hypothetical protein
MKQDENKKDPDVIKKLIAAEEEEALRRFRAHDFTARVKALVRAGEKSRGRTSSRLRIAVAAWAGAALLVLIGVTSLIIFVPRAPRQTIVQSIEDFFQKTPGGQRLMNQPAVSELNQGEILAGFEKIFLETFASLSSEQARGHADKSEKAPASGIQNKPHLDLQRTYEILIEEKSVERVLSSCLKKFKEV